MKNWKLWLGILLSALFMYLAFRHVQLGQMSRAFAQANYWYLLPAVATTFAAHGVRSLRWRYLLMPLGKFKIGPLFRALMIGYMFNMILPAHLGEIVRAYVLGRRGPVSKSAVFGTIVTERIIDVVALFLVLVFAIFVFPFPSWVRMGGYLTLFFILMLFALLLIMKRFPAPSLRVIDFLLRPFSTSLADKARGLFLSFMEGIVPLQRPSHYLIVGFLSILLWAMYGYVFQLALYAFDFVRIYSLPWTAPLVLLVITTFGVLVPSSPGYVGTYHWLCQQALALSPFNVPASPALTFAFVMHGANFIPVIFVGLAFLSLEGLTVRSLQNSVNKSEK